MELHLASMVISTAGRDKGKYFVIIGIIDENYVLICDGDIRLIEKPKKKKIKHLKPLNHEIESIKQKLELGSKITNADIRKSLAAKIDELGLKKGGI